MGKHARTAHPGKPADNGSPATRSRVVRPQAAPPVAADTSRPRARAPMDLCAGPGPGGLVAERHGLELVEQAAPVVG